MSEEITIEVSDKEVAKEVAYGISVRANQIHDNVGDDFEHIAEELKELSREVGKEYDAFGSVE